VSAEAVIRIRDLSKWYGEVLGVNRVSLDVPSGVTSLVGPNGCGKSTLMNLITGLLRPSKGTIEVLGHPTDDPESLHRVLGYCTSHDSFHDTFTGEEFLVGLLRTHALGEARTRTLAEIALDRVGLSGEARRRRIGGYSKGMRQRLKLALAIAHEPQVLVLDEPLNGLDPLGRSEAIGLFQALAREGCTMLISSHILHEVDLVSDTVVMLHHGYVVAEGDIQAVRSEISDRPLQVRVHCSEPAALAARSFEAEAVVSGRVEGGTVLVETKDPLGFASLVARLAVEDGLEVEGLEMADENVQAVYDYLIGPGGEHS
jgi:ABC-2 type transport system ATP-binding protein